MAAECAAVQHLGSAEAAEKVRAALSGLSYFISVDYEENMELIDARINTYYNLANIRMMPIECTQRFLEERMAGKKELELKGQSVGDREEALLFAVSVMYAGIEDFPYAVELKDDYVETDIARMSNMKIKRRQG